MASVRFFTPSFIAEVSKNKRKCHDLTMTTIANAHCSSFAYGDISVLHNLAIYLNHCSNWDIDANLLKMFHITVRTMRRAPDLSWVKMSHITTVCAVLHHLNTRFDELIESFKVFSQETLSLYSEMAETGKLTDGEFLAFSKGFKQIYDHITSPVFPEWIQQRANVFTSLCGGMKYKINLHHFKTQGGNNDHMLFIIPE